jgi:hypothetical protein
MRATCRALKKHADPIVFRHLRLCSHIKTRVNEHQIVSLLTRSSKACEFTVQVELGPISRLIKPRKNKWARPHIGSYKDLRVHLPTAISMLKNLRCFRSVTIFSPFPKLNCAIIRWGDPGCVVLQRIDAGVLPKWLINALAQAVSRLPRLIEVQLCGCYPHSVHFPLGLFSNLTRLCVSYIDTYTFSQMAVAIENSPQLRDLEWISTTNALHNPLPPLSRLFANISAENPLHLDRLVVESVEATLDRVILPHLMWLTSIRVHCISSVLAQRVWPSFRANPIKVADVEVSGFVTEDAMLYLSSFSGLKRLQVYLGLYDIDDERHLGIRKLLLEEVLPKHVNSLESLTVRDHYRPWVKSPYCSSACYFSLT